MVRPKVIVVSMEILVDNQPNYAGGLGMLAYDFIRSAFEQKLPIAWISLFYRNGYVYHEIVNKEIVDLPEKVDLNDYEKVCEISFSLKNLKIDADILKFKHSDLPIFFIDTSKSEDEIVRNVSERVYIENSIEERIVKELVLSLGTLEFVNKMNFEIEKFHLNESHSAFLAIELFKRLKDVKRVAEKLVFTTHTPLPHGHEIFDYKIVEKFYEIPEFIKKISPKSLNMSKIANFFSSFTNAVSYKHHLVVKKLIPYLKNVDWITNGIHHLTWSTEPTKKVFDKYLDGWRENPSLLSYSSVIPLNEIWKMKIKNKEKMIEFLNENSYYNYPLDTKSFTITARRRITGYKRLNLIFSSIEKVEDLGKKFGLQIVISGVAHPKDYEAKKMIKRFVDLISVLKHVKFSLYLRKGYESERIIIAGGDLLLHVPLPPFEACGTSWLRASLNAVPVLASRDGGVLEALIDGYNGFLFGKNLLEPKHINEFPEFIIKLENIAEIWKNDLKKYLEISRNAIQIIGHFNSHRMVKEYWYRAYRFKD